MKESLIKIFEFPLITDERGSLVSLEENKNIPFDISRVYYLFDNKNDEPRGFHAHKKLEQVAICLSGSCKFILDNGKKRESVILDHPSKGLYISNSTWREMHDFTNDCILLVLASDIYNESDYVRDYQEFLSMVGNL
jgi:dTDP-4-dehydrorhamnose 3,5-epimerase-like enzyme